MEITVRKSDLVKELQLVQGIVERKNSIPILSNVLAEAKGGEVRISATDLDVSLRCGCAAEVKTEGSITLAAKKLYEIVRSLPESDVRIKVLPDSWATIECERVSFKVIYNGYFSGPDCVVENYVVTPDEVQVTYELPGYTGPMRLVWPVLEDTGDAKTNIATKGQTVRVTLAGDTQTFTANGAASVVVEDTRYPFRNGWAKLAIAQYPSVAPATLVLKPTNSK